ncbi:hypothetical protein [Tahibacter amnicola]|uniref:Uncharacterized protein n=1 Tax=Tahibacter amnicola TaxID=2976241 RepID=A0ABY6BIS2_9GAMM|nr:hypothetical protein [Tahibacter amnicola]UXI69397.1 hypothetical protein N4264_07035 [Tahibacter amnicola]
MRRLALLLSAVLLSVSVQAQAPPRELPPESIPPVLRDWRGWVMKGWEHYACPMITIPGEAMSATHCAWPGKLTLDARADGVDFAQQWRVEAPAWVAMPGSEDYWPQDVQANGQPVPVLNHDDQPMVHLAAGTYAIKGRIHWVQRPQQLEVPETVALVELRVDGKVVTPLERQGESLTLGRGEVAEPEADAMSVEVFRKLTDSLPAQLETRLVLKVSGQAREETVGPALPAGFVATSLTGDIPARLDSEGQLHLQVQPGTRQVVLQSRATAPLTQVTRPATQDPWPAQEVWSFQAENWRRVVGASSDQPIDPAQSGVPGEWRGLPAFAMNADTALTLEERSRGLSEDNANRLTLSRQVWMQFDGAAMYAKDTVQGTLRRDWRMDVAAPYLLERAESGGAGLLVTRPAKGGERTGVELRQVNVDMQAGVRIAKGGGELPVAGWEQSFDAISWSLRLPNGYRLLAAPGADQARGSWISRWTLLDVFLVAIVALLIGRLLGWVGAAIGLGYLVFGYHEYGSPIWTLLGAAMLTLLARALPVGRLQNTATLLGRLCLVMLALISLPFAAAQLRYALYPQLERGYVAAVPVADQLMGMLANQAEAPMAAGIPMDAPVQQYAEEEATPMSVPAPPPAPAAPPAPVAEGVPQAKGDQSLDKVEVTGSRIRRAAEAVGSSVQTRMAKPKAMPVQRYAKNTVIQAGRGEPSWNYGQVYSLTWSGPVLPEQKVRLVIAPPWVVRPLRVIMVLLLAWTIATLARRLFAGIRRTGTPVAAASASLAMALALGASLFAPVPARAQEIPNDALLQQLRERLTEAPRCAPGCGFAARADVKASDDSLELALEIHAGERIAVPFPGGDRSLALAELRIDGQPLEHVANHEGHALIAVPRGVHRVWARYAVVESDQISLSFPLPPAHVRLDLGGWQADGVSENRLLGDTLTLNRERTAAAGPARGVAQQFPPYVRIERTLVIDLEWRVSTRVWRLAPSEGGFSVSVPLVEGEQVTTPDTKVENGKVIASFDADSSSVAWESTLSRRDAVTLAAPTLGDRAEVWKVVLSPTWHGEFAGLPQSPVAHSTDQWVHEFHPLPEEKLTVTLTRPEAVAGKSVAIDEVTLQTAAGRRAVDSTLELVLRGTQGGEHGIGLPAGSELLSVTMDGAVVNLQPRDNRLSLPLSPGVKRYRITVRQAQEMGLRSRTPTFDLGLPSANVRLALTLPDDRWVLFTWGPKMGPAVLYWGELVVMALLAFGLARTRRTPLTLWHWLLLGWGFSTASWFALALVAAWLFAMDWRSRNQPVSGALFNLAQVGLAFLTVIALVCAVGGVWTGLLGDPDMSVTGNGSWARSLRWFADQSEGILPGAGALTLPIWLFRVAMLAWALWMAYALTRWLRWAFNAWSNGGYWRSRPAPLPKPPRHVEETPVAPESPAPSGDATP